MKKNNNLIVSIKIAIYKLYSLFLLIALLIIIDSCDKNRETEIPKDTSIDYTSANNNSEADLISNDAICLADSLILNFKNKSYKTKYNWKCAEITKEIINKSYIKFTIDFGDTYKNCFFGKARKGKIIITYRGNYYIKGFADTIRFINYYIGGKAVEGIITINNIGNLSWLYKATDMKIIRPDSNFHIWNTKMLRQLLIDIKDTTNDINNYYYSIVGSSTGINIKSQAYSATIVKPLIKTFTCYWIQSGAINIKLAGKPDLLFDYGAGDCDNNASLTVNDKTYNIILP